jgi:hypothetical protein
MNGCSLHRCVWGKQLGCDLVQHRGLAAIVGST